MKIIIFIIGGITYGFIEVLYRGYTHWSMIITGGAVVLTFYILLSYFLKSNIFLAALIGSTIITTYEFFTGLIVNKIFKLHVWDYSTQPCNILGQICPAFSLIWFAICLVFFTIIKYNKYIFY